MPRGNPGGYNIFGDPTSGVKPKGKKVAKKVVKKGKFPFKPAKKSAPKKKVVVKKGMIAKGKGKVMGPGGASGSGAKKAYKATAPKIFITKKKK